MLWCMASSLLIHNTGLPLPILVSFLYLLFSITIGWNAIAVHTGNLNSAARAIVNEKLNALIKEKDSDREIDLD